MKLFRRHLVDLRDLPSDQPQNATESPELVIAFRDWFQTHRGVKEPTLRQYVRGATDLLQALGEDVGRWKAPAVRDFFLLAGPPMWGSDYAETYDFSSDVSPLPRFPR